MIKNLFQTVPLKKSSFFQRLFNQLPEENAVIELKNNTTSAILSDAIVKFENKDYIFIDNGNKQYEMKEVTIGDSENGYTEIVSIEDFTDKNIVIKGAYTLLMKMKNTEDE